MEERLLIFFGKEKPDDKSKPTQEPGSLAEKAAKRAGVKRSAVKDRTKVDPADSLCDEGSCRVPDAGDRKPVVEVVPGIDGKWVQIPLKDLDHKLNGGELILIGAVWCTACKKAKKELPKKYPKSDLFYVDFDTEDENELRAKFALGDSELALPILVGCSSKGQYERMKSSV